MVIFLSILLVVAIPLFILSLLGYAHNVRIWDIQIALGSVAAYREKVKAGKIIRRMVVGLLVLLGLLIYFW